jgi:hypothetical protein
MAKVPDKASCVIIGKRRNIMSKDYSLEELAELEKEQKKTERRFMTVLIIIIGIAGILINWHFAINKGLYSGWMALLSPGLVVGATYSIFFPNDFTSEGRQKFSARMWIAIIIGLFLTLMNFLALKYGPFWES